jgi:hypothetical protein
MIEKDQWILIWTGERNASNTNEFLSCCFLSRASSFVAFSTTPVVVSLGDTTPERGDSQNPNERNCRREGQSELARTLTGEEGSGKGWGPHCLLRQIELGFSPSAKINHSKHGLRLCPMTGSGDIGNPP